MFFAVSGFCIKITTLRFFAFLMEKKKSLLISYYFFGFLHFFYFSITNGFSFDRLNAVLLYPNYGKVPICGAIWFLMALFFAYIFYYWVNRLKNGRIVWIVVFALSLTDHFCAFQYQIAFCTECSYARDRSYARGKSG